jgi:hypothetical protein
MRVDRLFVRLCRTVSLFVTSRSSEREVAPVVCRSAKTPENDRILDVLAANVLAATTRETRVAALNCFRDVYREIDGGLSGYPRRPKTWMVELEDRGLSLVEMPYLMVDDKYRLAVNPYKSGTNT